MVRRGRGSSGVRFNPSGLLVSLAAIAVFWSALATGTAALVDGVVLTGLLLFLLIGSASVLVARAQGRRVAGQAGAYVEIRHWILKLLLG